MMKVIEVMSSDEEINEEPKASATQLKQLQQAPINHTIAANSQEYKTNDFEKSAMETQTLVENTGTMPSSSENMTSQQQEQKRPRHGRRKSTHLTRSSSEIEFLSDETIKTKEPQKMTQTKPRTTVANKNKKCSKISILASKPLTSEQIFNAEFEDFLNEEPTIKLIKEIAAERVRVNHLLTLNAMPEIQFSLYRQPERLEFQLTDRFRQRQIRLESLSSSIPKDV